jgi:hypothetical protein
MIIEEFLVLNLVMITISSHMTIVNTFSGCPDRNGFTRMRHKNAAIHQTSIMCLIKNIYNLDTFFLPLDLNRGNFNIVMLFLC